LIFDLASNFLWIAFPRLACQTQQLVWKLKRKFTELGWTLNMGNPPEALNMLQTEESKSNQHPVWNQQFLIANPTNIKKNEGFLYLGFKDKSSGEIIDQAYIPLDPMRQFIPYNFVTRI
jgi:hypothetical protein